MTIDVPAIALSLITGGVVTKVVEIILTKKKNKADVDSIVTNTYKSLLETIQKELESVKKKDEEWEKELLAEQSGRKLAHERNSRYHIEVRALQTELALVKQALAVYSPNVVKVKVFVVDDMPYVLDLFKARLGSLLLIDLQCFSTAGDFIKEIEQKPAIVVLDYDLDNHLTAEDVIRYLKDAQGWYPRIIIVTGHPVEGIAAKLENDVWQVRSKDGAYVIEVSTAIMEYIREISL